MKKPVPTPSPLPRVSDHAVLRWIERRYGFDIEAERQKIDALTAPAIAAGATVLKVDGVQFVLKGGRVVTTLEGGMGNKPKSRITVEARAT